ncbi:hypothetical protein [Brevibacterium luteolum]|uniref:hypothetical protein n=1 Tax=Brevibacterium luteolum TaxID=199591 RepID=UPI00223B7718|nr:hypothetical protein [Brevibacterium luteolum]MCT1874594.1 hypothetical protein [Brevibacterium luteolum]MCT1889640.1 hypothetical protein [Brevibacterium luteolum]MCT1893247.1 hypothetical protein [Brevibacterium luteolum]MCT1925163.1 hypothetical protein [Brevibacterium luteolum]
MVVTVRIERILADGADHLHHSVRRTSALFSDEGRASAMFRLHLFSRRVIDLMYVCTSGCCS